MRSKEAFAYSRSTGYFCSVTASTVRIDASNDKYKTKDKTRIMCLSEIKARQSAKIRQLAEAAKLTGLHTLDELASALGIPRSTAWTIRNGGHKASGLSVSIIDSHVIRAEASAVRSHNTARIHRRENERIIRRE